MLNQPQIPAPEPSTGWKAAVKALQTEIAALQQAVRAANLPVVVLFEGWSAAGKGRVIGKLIAELDPRGYQVYSNTAAEALRPFLWRFWRDLPPRGELAVDEMLQKTSTAHAPWVIVEGNDKKYARLKVLRTVRKALEARLEDR